MYDTHHEPNRKLKSHDSLRSTYPKSLTIVVPHPRQNRPPLRNKFEVELQRFENGHVHIWNINGRIISRQLVPGFLGNTVFSNIGQYDETMTFGEIINGIHCYLDDEETELQISAFVRDNEPLYTEDGAIFCHFRMLVNEFELRCSNLGRFHVILVNHFTNIFPRQKTIIGQC